jgi:DNA polymerase III epsilon subunit-like protein
MNFLAIDTETSGLSPDKHALLEIAIIPIINGVKKDPFVSYIRPHVGATIDIKALEINKLTFAQIQNFPDGKQVLNDLIKWIDSHNTVFNLLAHNAKFDRDFLYRFFTRHGSHGEFITRIDHGDVCTLEMAKKIFTGKGVKPSSNKLGDLCRFFNIELLDAHSALPDIEATYEVYQCLKALSGIKMETQERPMTYQEKRAKYLDMSYVTFNGRCDIFITEKMTKDPAAARFIAEEIYRRFGE